MRYIYLLLTILIFSSCEDVVDISLQEGTKRLVIDANINWEKGTIGNEQVIRHVSRPQNLHAYLV